MHSRLSLLWGLLAVIIGVEGLLYAFRAEVAANPTAVASEPEQAIQLADLEAAVRANTPEPTKAATSAPKETPQPKTVAQTSEVVSAKKADAPQQQVAASANTTIQSEQAAWTQGQAARIENPYPTPPQTLDVTTAATRGALVNIICSSDGIVRPISGSGVVIDPRGIILTNAHVAQYVLLSKSNAFNLSCTIRTGSPSRPAWSAGMLYIPPVWVNAHVKDINAGQAARGMGEHDYALLIITDTATGTPLASQAGAFSYLPVDTREAIGFLDDEVMSAGYPVEFLGSAVAEKGLYFFSSRTSIKQLLTFGSGSVDLISLGGVLEAQSGSSGGAVVNPWGKLIGVITTTSDAITTVQRDMRALTLSYISRDMKAQTGSSLEAFLSGNVHEKAAAFNVNVAPALIGQYLNQLSQSQQ